MNAATIAKAVLAAWEARDLDKTASLLTDNFVLTGPAPEPLSKAAFLTFQKVHNDAFADWSFNARDFQEQGQVVRITIQITATHTGDFDVSKLGLPIPPITASGKSRQWPQETLITDRGRQNRGPPCRDRPSGWFVGRRMAGSEITRIGSLKPLLVSAEGSGKAQRQVTSHKAGSR